jgi:glycosyltransferase involved in cell wall biosynthesis
MPISISCVIPVFNGERFLSESLDSVFAQTLPPAEVIVVDDGSTDGTADVIASYGERLVSLRQENAGPATARNRGLRAAHGDLIALQDADDVWDPDKLAVQAARFAARPELEISLTHVRNFWDPELKIDPAALADHPMAQPAIPGYTLQTMMVRREALTRIGLLNENLRFGEDVEWFIRARDAKAIVEVLPDVLVHRRFHRGNLTWRVPDAVVRDRMVDSLRESLERRRRQAANTGSREGG